MLLSAWVNVSSRDSRFEHSIDNVWGVLSSKFYFDVFSLVILITHTLSITESSYLHMYSLRQSSFDMCNYHSNTIPASLIKRYVIEWSCFEDTTKLNQWNSRVIVKSCWMLYFFQRDLNRLRNTGQAKFLFVRLPVKSKHMLIPKATYPKGFFFICY